MKLFIGLTLITLSFTSMAGTKKIKVVYGEDNRKDLYEVKNPLFIKLAKSTAAMVQTQYLSKHKNGFSSVIGATLETGLNVCPSERFSQQPLLSNCSGFLVGKNTIVTAGHCYDGDHKKLCRDSVWVFDYKMKDSKNINLDGIKKENVYRCKKVVKQIFSRYQDFAVITLAREVEDRAPLKFRKQGKIKSDSELVVIGHPSMLPLKVSDGGTVLKNNGKYQFTTSLDTFQGNSGSAVFDSKTGILEGILVSGKTDYISSDIDDEKSCTVVNTCDQDGSNCFGTDSGSVNTPGENVTRITSLSKYFK
jgi:V8-like Glu-specific endopeptidase